MAVQKKLISVVVPAYNEEAGIVEFYRSILEVLNKLGQYNSELIIIDDGSHDNTAEEIRKLTQNDPHVRLLCLSRNFGKEIATTAGIHAARGSAVLTLDADEQHPVELIPDFLKRWEKGAKVVVGVRTANQNEGFVKRYGSKVFYKIFNKVTGIELIPGSTDFRLIDSSVKNEFVRMTEHNRITRGLIDWLGYQREYIKFVANPRLAGEASYSFKKLLQLAIDSIISNSTSPLYITAYIGFFMLPLSILLGIFMLVDSLLSDPLKLHITGSAYVIVLMLFLVSILLISQGIIGMYLSHIHTETKNRPLYIIDTSRSIGP